MQRSFVARSVSRCVLMAAVARPLVSAPQMRTSQVRIASAPVTATFTPARFYAGGGHDEPAARSGQYLLDKNDVLTRVMEVVKNFEKVDASKVTPESHFVNDLGLSSLEVVEVVFAIEQEFILDIPDHDAEKIQSIPDAVEYIAQNPMAKTVKKTAVGGKPGAAATTNKNAIRNNYYDDDDDDDEYDTSSTEYSDNSMEFQPLAFQLYNGGATRHSGVPLNQRIKSMKFSGKEFMSDSDDDSEMALKPTTEKNGARRCFGKTKSTLKKASFRDDFDVASDDDSSFASPLPAKVEGRKRSRSTGAVKQKNMEAANSEAPQMSSDEEEDEKPLNSDVILNLVRRIRAQPIDKIPLEAFQNVNWGDENFQEELKPLKAIYEYLEIKAHAVKSIKPVPQSTARASEAASAAKVKEAVLQLPPEKAIVAKIKKVKDQNLRTAAVSTGLYKNAENGEDPVNDLAGDRNINLKSNQNGNKANAERKGANNKAGAASKNGLAKGVTVEIGAPPAQVKKLKSSLILPSESNLKTKEGYMHEDEKKVRKTAKKKGGNNRSLNFSDVLPPESTEEIVERDQELPSGLVQERTADASNPTSKNKTRKTRNVRGGNGVDFVDVPEDEQDGGILENENAKPRQRKPRNQRRGNNAGRSVSFTDLPREDATEIDEHDTSLGKDNSKAAALKPGKKAAKRPNNRRSNNRSCSFSEIITEQAGEIKEENSELISTPKKNTPHVTRDRSNTLPASPKAAPAGKLQQQKQNSAPKRRSTVDGARATDFGFAPSEVAGEVKEGDGAKLRGNTNTNRDKNVCSAGNMKNRRQKQGKGRSREISISQLAEETAGEITEDNNAVDINDKPLSKVAQRVPEKTSGSSDPKKPNTARAAVRAPASTTDKGAGKTGPHNDSSAPVVRARRKVRPKNGHSYELSFSALPEDEVGEIKEKFTESIEGSSARSSLPNQQMLPSIRSSVSRSGNTPNLRKSLTQQTSLNIPQGKFVVDTLEPDLGAGGRRKSASVPK